jgi:hypothetical protein
LDEEERRDRGGATRQRRGDTMEVKHVRKAEDNEWQGRAVTLSHDRLRNRVKFY